MSVDTEKKLRILVVEDEVEVQEVVVSALEMAGFTVDSAMNGSEALEILRNQTFDLVLSDINMPNGDGIWLINAVRNEGNQVPFIFVSGDIDAYTSIKAKTLGASAFLQKPVRNKDIINAIVQVLKGTAL